MCIRDRFNYIVDLQECHLIPPAAFAVARAVYERAVALGLPRADDDVAVADHDLGVVRRLDRRLLGAALDGTAQLRLADSLLAGVPLAADLALQSQGPSAQVRGALTLGGNRLTLDGQGGADAATDQWRATLQAMARHGGELWDTRWRKPRTRPAPLVLLADISGSMSRYSRMLLHFGHLLGHADARVESFVFGTRLTRTTRLLKSRDPDIAVGQVIGRLDAIERQIFQTAVDAREVGETGDEFGIAADRAGTRRADEPGRTGADSFDRFGAVACLFDIDPWR